MKEIICPFEKFNFESFLKDILEFGDKIISPDYVIAWVHKFGDEPEFRPRGSADEILSMMKDENKIVYFAFTDVNSGEPIECADGNEYEKDEDDHICIGDIDTAGYAFKFKDGNFIINSAVNAGGGCTFPPPSVDLLEDCDLFEKPMIEFINKYIG